MNVWWCVPSARPMGGTIELWRRAGYKIAVWRNPGEAIAADICVSAPYPGYAVASNALIKAAAAVDPQAAWFVGGGDDVCPDTRPPADIARECEEHFGGTFGVMQPTGDRWGNYSIERIAGSPWIGREFARRVNCGAGPWWPEYLHCFVDNELLEVSSKLGIYWPRRDLTHRHNHWTRNGETMPEFLKDACSMQHWVKYKALFEIRMANRFPGSELSA